MSDPQSVPGYRFGVYELDCIAGELRKRGIRIRLQTQPRRVLEMLLARPGEVISREDIQQTLWPGETFVDFEHGLNSAVNKIRSALSDSAANPMFLETVPRQGYRFIAPVERLTPAAPPAPARPPAPPAPPASGPVVRGDQLPAGSLRRPPKFVGAILGALAAAAILLWSSGSLTLPTFEDANRRGNAIPLSTPATWGTRILAGQDVPQTGPKNAVWEADRFFVGGLIANRPGYVGQSPRAFLFDGERYGQFRYIVPVPPGVYRVTLHFAETWFGAGNDGGGGVGSRSFDVAINRTRVLTDFDPLAQAGGPNRPIAKTYDGIEPNADGQIAIEFIPKVQNAMVNAIEITAEQ